MGDGPYVKVMFEVVWFACEGDVCVCVGSTTCRRIDPYTQRSAEVVCLDIYLFAHIAIKWIACMYGGKGTQTKRGPYLFGVVDV